MNLVAICRNLLGSPMKTHTTLCAGDWVEVRSKEEILETLDKNGRLDGLPFMPQMFKYCGQRFQVYKRAHKTCDTVSGIPLVDACRTGFIWSTAATGKPMAAVRPAA